MKLVNVGGIGYDGRFSLSTTIDLENDPHLVMAYCPTAGVVNAEVFDNVYPVET